MLELFQPYLVTILCLLAVGGLLLIQLLVADVVGLTSGHVPGSAVTTTHDDFHFRATRALANTNESVAAFLLLVVSGMLLGASAQWMSWLSVIYVGARFAHMTCYWLGFSTFRSISFIVSLVALFGLLIAGGLAVF